MFLFIDRMIEELDQGLRVLSGAVSAHRDVEFPEPVIAVSYTHLTLPTICSV